MSIVSKPDRRAQLINDARQATDALQVYLDDITTQLNNALLGAQVQLKSYTTSTLPPASVAGGMIYVTDAVGGSVPAFSDGSDWRRVTDRVVI